MTTNTYTKAQMKEAKEDLADILGISFEEAKNMPYQTLLDQFCDKAKSQTDETSSAVPYTTDLLNTCYRIAGRSTAKGQAEVPLPKLTGSMGLSRAVKLQR